MADIFISYARSTAPQAQKIAEALRALGYGVWRDDELPAHRAYAEVIEERLKAAKAVVVIWSAEGVRSEWVQSEADRARNDRKLVQLSVDGTALPMPFDRIQCADLAGWSGDLAAPGWRKVVASIADLIGGAPPAHTPNLQSERTGISICVLPFANMSNDVDQEYFADGISEDIITDLSKVSALSVIARNTAFTFKGKHVDVPQVARQLRVSHVLEGSVRKSGNRVRITAQLIDGSGGDHLWAERYDRDLSDIFALQDEISQAIVKALKVKLLPEEKKAIEDRGTENAEAYDLYLRSRPLAGQFGIENLKRAADLLRRAIALDPRFFRAYHELVSTLSNYMIVAPEHSAEAQSEVREIEARAVALAPNDLFVATLRAGRLAQSRDYLSAERVMELVPEDFQRRLSVNGQVFVGFIGRFEEALQILRERVRLDPLDRIVAWVFRDYLDITGRLDEAVAEHERSKDLPGERGFMELCAFLRMKGHAKPEALQAQYRDFLACRGADMRLPFFDQLAPVLLDPEAARPLIREAIADPLYQDFTRMIWLALFAGFYDATGEALVAMRRAYIDMDALTHLNRYMWMPVLSGARRDPRFKAIVRDLGLYDYWKESAKWGDFVRPVGADDFEVLR